MSLNTWTHFALVYARGAKLFWVNGELEAFETIQGATLTYWDDSYPLLIGNEDTLDRPFAGKIDVISIWSKDLDADTLTTLAGSR